MEILLSLPLYRRLLWSSLFGLIRKLPFLIIVIVDRRSCYVFSWNTLLADFYWAHLFRRMFTLERSIFLVFINTTMGYHIFAACVGPTMFMEVSSLMLRNVKRGSIQLMVSLNLTLNSSATSEIDWTAQISKSKVITVLPWFLDWAEYWFYILFFYCITNLTLYTSMP